VPRGRELDHLVVTAPSLQVGVAWVEAALGVALEPGGEHERMGTHNALLKLGDEQYVEVLAVNPDAVGPRRPRWFGLDGREPGSSPRLATWVARTDDIETAAGSSPEPLGPIEPMSRGSFDWLITVRSDGSLPGEGVVPSLIEWRSARHPARLLPDRGCQLLRLEGFHPEAERIASAVEALGLSSAVIVKPLPGGERPYLVAHMKTPRGARTIGGPSLIS
jgi:hypothetical protein